MDEKAIAVIRGAALALRAYGSLTQSAELLALLPREETLEEAVEALLEGCAQQHVAGGGGTITADIRFLPRLRAALERRKAGK